MARLIALTGLRIGELLATRCRCLDLEIGTLSMRESVYEGKFNLRRRGSPGERFAARSTIDLVTPGAAPSQFTPYPAPRPARFAGVSTGFSRTREGVSGRHVTRPRARGFRADESRMFHQRHRRHRNAVARRFAAVHGSSTSSARRSGIRRHPRSYAAPVASDT